MSKKARGNSVSIHIGGNAAGAKITAVGGDLHLGKQHTQPEPSARSDARAQEAYHALRTRFSLEEIAGLCFELGIEADDLPGDTRQSRARALTQHAARLGKLDDLLALIKRERPL